MARGFRGVPEGMWNYIPISITVSLTHRSPKEPSPSPATRACWSSPSPRRTFLAERRSTTSREFNHRYHSINQHRYLISLGQHFAWYRLCATRTENGEDEEANVIFTPQCTEFRGFCAFHSGDSHLDLVCASTLYAIMPLSINALLTLFGILCSTTPCRLAEIQQIPLH